MKKKYCYLFCWLWCLQLIGQTETQTTNTQTTQDFFAFIESLENAIDLNDDAFMVEYFDSTTVNQIVAKAPSKKHISLYKNTINKKLKSFINTIYEKERSGSHYDFINYSQENDSIFYALFRFYSNEEGINYHQYKIKLVSEKFQIQDIYILLTGQYISESITNSFQNVYKTESKTDVDLYQKFLVLNNTGRKKKAYEVICKIKDSTLLNKQLLVLKSKAASAVSEEAYKEAIKDILKKYPQDPCSTLLSIDYYYLTEDYNHLFRAIDALELYTDDDFLRFFKANFAFEIEEYRMAKEHYEYITKNFPAFLEADIMLLHTYHQLDESKNAIHLLSNMVAEGVPKKELVDLVKTDLHDFYKTKDFKTWKRKH